jgi:hypothetical protein
VKERIVNLTYAVDRLYEIGWLPDDEAQVEFERLPDGRRFPSVLAVQREFARAGLELAIKQNLMFKCYRATWAPLGEPLEEGHASDERHSTVVGSCQREAAVYALAQLRQAQSERQLAGASSSSDAQFATAI